MTGKRLVAEDCAVNVLGVDQIPARHPKEQVINTTAVIRHALHEAEHHLLDVRRGIARQQLGG